MLLNVDYKLQSGDSMTHFHYVAPIYRKSSKKFALIDANGNRIGDVQRHYNSTLHHIVDNIFSDYLVNVEVFDTEGRAMSKAIEVWSLKTMIRSEWKVDSNRLGKFVLRDKTMIKTNPCMEFAIDNKVYSLKRDFMDRTTTLKNSSDRVTALITYDRIFPPRTFTIELFDDEMDIYTLSCIFYLFSLRD
ncbi:tubby C-terminal domain-like protein [Paenibacillus alvei]|uniref:tubby C-terminal domain-like protein n=1 Tax=Paenibacillus alvei TaxID=44250 RepID=UPI003B97BC05